MARTYTVPFSVALTAAGEIVAITGAANVLARMKRVVCKAINSTLPAAQQFQVSGTIFTTITGGTGGVNTTPAKVDVGDAGASFTALAGNTVANTGTHANVPYEDGGYLYLGIDTPLPGRGIPIIGTTQVFVLALVSTPAGSVSVTFAGYVEVEEEG